MMGFSFSGSMGLLLVALVNKLNFRHAVNNHERYDIDIIWNLSTDQVLTKMFESKKKKEHREKLGWECMNIS